MPYLFIEDLAKKLGKEPQQLRAIEFKKYLVLIDAALALVKGPAEVPYLTKTELSQEELTHLLDVIAKGIKEGKFSTLDNKAPDINDMADAIIELGEALDLNEKAIELTDEFFPTMPQYLKKIEGKAYLHTESLTYKPDFSAAAAENINQANARLSNQYDKLKTAKVFTAKRSETIAYNADNNQLEIKDIHLLNPSKTSSEENAADLVYFYLDIMSTLNKIKSDHKLKIPEGLLNNLYKKIQPYIVNINNNESRVVTIAGLMRSLMPNDSKDKLKSSIGEDLSKLMMKNQALRAIPFLNFSFRIFNEISDDMPIHRAIMIGPEDLTNDEVLRSLKMMLRNHQNENIVVTFDPKDIDKVNAHNKKLDTTFTLNVIGHGTLKGIKKLNANLGPFRGSASVTGDKLADLVNRCRQIDHLRVTGCFTGLIKDNVDLRRYREKERADYNSNDVCRTYTIVADTNLTDENSPFVETSVAVNCWNRIDKNGREISMTVSPGIIEPDEEIGRMVWRSSVSSNRDDEGVKEIRITTPEGPKNKLRKK